MGVKGLWKLLDGTGRHVDLESLEGKVLAVDISVWLNMAVKGMRDYHGNASQTAHLVSLFNRICKLLYHGIKPVFVFDGKAPVLKQKTLRERRYRKTVNVHESKKANEKILQNFLKKQLLDEVMSSASTKKKDKGGVKRALDKKSKTPASTIKQKPLEDDIYDLPALSANLNNSDDSELEEELSMRAELQREFHDNVTNNDFQNILDVNIESKDFNSLPSDVQYELLQDLHEVRKRQRTRIETMPEESNSFSNYQIKGLLAKHKITKKMESVENKMSHENVEASVNFFGFNRESMEDHTVVARQLVSDSKSHFIWLRKSSGAKRTGQNEDQFEKKDEIAMDQSLQEPKKLQPENIRVPVTSNMQISSVSVFNDQTDSIASAENVITSGDSDNSHTMIHGSLTRDVMDDIQVHSGVTATITHNNSKHSKSDNDILPRTLPQNEPCNIKDLHNSETGKLINFEDCVDLTQAEVVLPVPLNSFIDDRDKNHSCSSMSENSNQLSEVPCLQILPPSLTQQGILKEKSHNDSADILEIVDMPISQQTSLMTDQSLSDEEESTDSSNAFEDVPEEAHAGKLNTSDSCSPGSIGQIASNIEPQEEADLRRENPWEGLDIADVGKYTDEIDHQSKELYKLMQARDRAARDVTQSAQLECQDLLKLFGLPYIVSPQEAEAQCAALEEIGLTDGTITDDSDIWLFGGKFVIKDMFGSGKDPVAYHVSDIETQLGLNRDRFICIALCSGSDYTRGIHGVGPVTAMEILKEFDGTGITGLIKLKQWWDGAVTSPKQTIPTETKIKSQIRRVNLKKDFPSESVYNAYMQPVVDTEKQTFEWGFPDLDELRMFAANIMGWTRLKVDDILLPVIKRQGERRSAQSKITNYFQPTFHPIEKKRSKRVQRAAKILAERHDLKKSTTTKTQRKKKAEMKKDNQSLDIKLSESSSSEEE